MWSQDLRPNRARVLRPLNFLCGAFTSLCLLYLGRSHLDGGTAWSPVQREVSISDDRSSILEGSQGHTACSSLPVSTGLADSSVDEVYSIGDHVQNSTLGFEQIFALNLAERTDRRDRLTLMSVYQDVKITWMNSVVGKDLSEKARPAHFNYDRLGPQELPDGYLGSWRAHVVALQRIVENGISSALILEDDADWDVNLKQQLVHFAECSRNIDNKLRSADDQLTPTTTSHSPYGDHWDLLWVGSCYNSPGTADAQAFPAESNSGSHLVWKNKAEGGMACIYGYAVTYEGAKKLLGLLLDIDRPIDSGPFNTFCHLVGECIVVWPRLIGSYRPAGFTSQDSDNANLTGTWREKGNTPNIVNSAIVQMMDTVGESWLGHGDERKKQQLMDTEKKQGAAMDKQREAFETNRVDD